METIELISMAIGGLTLVGVVILAVYSIFYDDSRILDLIMIVFYIMIILSILL